MSIKHTPDQGDERRQVGLFSVSANGELCFHAGETDAKLLCETLDEGVTGGPYTALVAFASQQREPQEAGKGVPFGYWHEGPTEDESEFFLAKDLPSNDCPRCFPLYLAPSESVAVALSDAKDATRYRWLRGGMRKTRRPDDAPYVVNPRRSKLYAVVNYAGEELDAAIDEDRLNDMTQWVYEEALTEGDNRFADPNFRFSDEFTNECTEKARAILALTNK